MAAIAINNKNLLRNILLQNQKAYDFETQAAMILKLYKLYINHDPVMSYLFYGKVNIGHPCILMGKIVKM